VHQYNQGQELPRCNFRLADLKLKGFVWTLAGRRRDAIAKLCLVGVMAVRAAMRIIHTACDGVRVGQPTLRSKRAARSQLSPHALRQYRHAAVIFGSLLTDYTVALVDHTVTEQTHLIQLNASHWKHAPAIAAPSQPSAACPATNASMTSLLPCMLIVDITS
jgi:hypothetical protein